MNKNDNAGIEEDDVQLQLRPPKEQRFNNDTTKEIIASVLNEELTGKTYDPNKCEDLCREIGNKIKAKIRESVHSNYKLICHTRLGEQRGAGIRVVARCLWDSENDGVATESFENVCSFTADYLQRWARFVIR